MWNTGAARQEAVVSQSYNPLKLQSQGLAYRESAAGAVVAEVLLTALVGTWELGVSTRDLCECWQRELLAGYCCLFSPDKLSEIFFHSDELWKEGILTE